MRLNALLFSRKSKGFVLVSVLMLGVMLISCATAFSWFARMQVRSIGSELQTLTSRTMSHVLASAIISVFSEVSSRSSYDSPTQRWFQPFVFNVPDMGIWVVQIVPLDDKIPLRNLFLPDGNTLRREMTDVWRDMWDKLQHRELEQITLDFMDRNDKPRVGSVEQDYFLNRPPYDISELLILSNDITPDMLNGSGTVLGLSDYCTVYSDGKINLNVAPLHVMELLPGLDTGGLAERIVRTRTEEPLTGMGDLQRLPGASGRTSTLLMNIAGFKSRYLEIKLERVSGEDDSGSSYRVIFDRNSKQIVKWEEL